MTVDFAPIKVTACDEDKVRKASGSKERYVVPFLVSAKPTSDWEDIFDDVWRSARKKSPAPKAQAYVRKGLIIVECGLDDVKNCFPNLRSAIEATNEKYLEQLKHKAEKNEKKKRKQEEERAAERLAIKAALEGLDFS